MAKIFFSHRFKTTRRIRSEQRFVFHRAKKVYFFKIIPLDGVFPAKLVSDSWRRYFSATVSKQPEESDLNNVLSSIARKRCISSKLFRSTECFQPSSFLIHGEDIFQPPFQNNPKNPI